MFTAAGNMSGAPHFFFLDLLCRRRHVGGLKLVAHLCKAPAGMVILGDGVAVAEFTKLALDICGNPHLASTITSESYVGAVLAPL